MLLLRNKDQQYNNPLATFATRPCGQRSRNEWIASSSLHNTQDPDEGGRGGQCPGRYFSRGRHFWWKEGIANGLSRVNLKLDLGLGFRFWSRLDPTIRPSLNVCPGVPSRLAKCPGISLQWNFQNLLQPDDACYEIIPSWKAWLCFYLWFGGAALFDCGGAALFNSPGGGTSPCRGPDNAITVNLALCSVSVTQANKLSLQELNQSELCCWLQDF